MMLIQILFKNIGKVAPVKNKRLGFMFIKRFIKKLDIACRISLQKRKMKLKECIGKPKDFWKAIKSLGPPSKSGGCIAGALAENEIKKHDTKSILKTFKCFYLNLARIFFAKFLKSPNLVSDYYKKLSLSENFKLDSTTEGYLFNILKNVEVTKAAEIGQISGKFLKDGVRILAKPFSKLCNLSIH